jgi:hypothetical protein
VFAVEIISALVTAFPPLAPVPLRAAGLAAHALSSRQNGTKSAQHDKTTPSFLRDILTSVKGLMPVLRGSKTSGRRRTSSEVFRHSFRFCLTGSNTTYIGNIFRQMSDNADLQSNNCAYCLKPVVDNFICADCMTARNLSVERVGPPSEEIVQPPAETVYKANEKPPSPIKDAGFDSERKEPPRLGRQSSDVKWKKFPLHADFATVGKRANLITWTAIWPVAGVGFGVASMFGFPAVLATCIALGLGFGWVIYRSEQVSWYHYASWVFIHGQTMECELDLVSSGELDQPYVVLKDENRIARIHETRVFKLVAGDVKKLLTEFDSPGRKTSHVAVAHYERQIGENAVIFEIDNCILWCKAHLSRGI